jgi:3,4-dihydroxy 2-butanone 4-phosphate synthase/GTP cyclohydrolase II
MSEVAEMSTLAPTTASAPAPVPADPDHVVAVERATEAIGRGGFAVVVDEVGNGGLVLAAQATTPEKVAFMIRHTSGVISVPLEGERLDALLLPLMVVGGSHAGPDTTGPRSAFTVSVDARHGMVTGASAADRCLTVHALIDPGTKPADLARPGHVFPERCDARGLLGRAGTAEAAVDLARLAGLRPAGVTADLVADDGALLHGPALARFARRHRLPLVAIAELVRYRREREKLVHRVSHARVPTPHGDFTAVVYESVLDGSEHVAFVLGDVTDPAGVPVHVHSECLTGDTFGSLRCDCRRRLDAALRHIAATGAGVLVYRRADDRRRGGAVQELLHPELHQDRPRHDGLAAQVLADLGVPSPAAVAEDRAGAWAGPFGPAV